MKNATESEMEQAALIIQEMCKSCGATFIVDDNVELAKKINADGVHLGKNDMPVPQARKILGKQFIIGATVNSFEDISCHMQDALPDYFGCGPYRFTSTKQKLAPILGMAGYQSIIQKMREDDIRIPIVAIGGITKGDVCQLMDTGIDGIALSGSVLQADDPIDEMRQIKEVLQRKC
jgi:thiamine-phosphate pyrophosphorylase